MSIAPIVLFTYNRPFHTLKTLEALKDNKLASQSIIYVYCDGAKENATALDIENINEVKRIVKQNQWCKEVHVIEQKENRGLAKSIVNGVTAIIEKHHKVIVLEDDIVTSPMFLTYMNSALDYYENEERVMHISGYMPPISTIKKPFFFYNQTSCWGWATWGRAWKNYNQDAKFLKEEIIKQNRQREFNVNNSYPFLTHLQNNIDGTWETWAIKWHASVFLQKGLCLHPNVSYTQNIGMDGSGENCSTTDIYTVNHLNETIFQPVQKLVQDKGVLKKVVKYNLKTSKPRKRNLLFKVYFKMKSLITKA